MKLHHLNPQPVRPKKVVVVGAGGFIGGSVARDLMNDGVNTVPISRREIDFLDNSAAVKFQSVVQGADALVVALAEAPCKDSSVLVRNIQMLDPIASVIGEMANLHVVYISSDAVYADSSSVLHEDSCCTPTTIHGVMHLAREIMLGLAVKSPLAIVRPTMVFGDDDSHNGYGPNRFKREAVNNETIRLFGEGEELRDHVWVNDVTAIIAGILYKRSAGVVNAVTGEVNSFREIASMIVNNLHSASTIEASERTVPMPHNGYRAFDNSLLREAFPEITLTTLSDVYS